MTAIRIDDDGATATFTGTPTPDTRHAWCDWMRRHGINPEHVAIHGGISRNETTRRVSYLDYVRGDTGRPTLVDGDIKLECHTIQLEAPPLPFPEVTE